MILDGDHTPEEFEKARRMEDVSVIPDLAPTADEFSESDERCPHGMRDLEEGGCTCITECALGYDTPPDD